MHWLDWTIAIAAILVVVIIGLRTQRYMRGVADFLTAGRVAGRYVLCVAGAEAGMGLISLVAMFETYYNSGFAYGFWGSFSAPIGIVLGLTGYCVYRFRETRAMTMGQFLEMRYSRRFRLFAGILQSLSGILNYALFPAVGARFIVYFCGLPVHLNLGGWMFPTFALLMALFLGLAVLVATKGGQITIMVTDCVQGLLSYPMYLVVVAYLLMRMSWFRDMAPALLDRPPGKSLINPFDISGLRDFNIFYVVVGILGGILNRMGWSGSQGYSVAARNAHEQKIGGILGTWRAGFSTMMYILLAICAFTFLNSDRFQGGDQGAAACRVALGIKAAEDVASGEKLAAVREKLALNVEFGARMKVNTLVTHPERIEGRHETFESVVKLFEREEARHGMDAVIDAMAENFREMGRLAQAAGVNVAIENLGRFGPLGDLQTLPKLVDRIDHPAIGYCLDSGHAHAAGESVPEWIRTMGDKLFTTHFHDNRALLMRTNNTARFVGAHDGGDEHMSPGFGTIPWIDVIQALRKLPYARPLNFETGGWPFVEGAESYRLAIAWWRACEQLATKKGSV